jgi:phenylalanyl-tRNA synthetase beta subunit
MQIINLNSSNELVKIELFDVYSKEKNSFSFALYFQSDTETLGEDFINSEVARIVACLKDGLHIELRGEL